MFERGFEDPAAMLWMTMLIIQSLPYAATVATAWVSARSYGRGMRPEIPATQNKPVLPKAA